MRKESSGCSRLAVKVSDGTGHSLLMSFAPYQVAF